MQLVAMFVTSILSRQAHLLGNEGFTNNPNEAQVFTKPEITVKIQNVSKRFEFLGLIEKDKVKFASKIIDGKTYYKLSQMYVCGGKCL